MGSEWPDKRDKTGFGSMSRGGGMIFRVDILPRLRVCAAKRLNWYSWTKLVTGLPDQRSKYIKKEKNHGISVQNILTKNIIIRLLINNTLIDGLLSLFISELTV